MLRRKRVKLGTQKIKIESMPARQGLETVVLLTQVIHENAPRLALIGDPSRKMRVANTLHVVMSIRDLPDLLLNIVVLGTGLPLEEIEKATTHEVLKALAVIIRVNNWDVIWQSAYALRIIDDERIKDWFWARIPLLRTR